MARLALNKSSLKKQRDQLKTYKKFLPSLDLKRQQLQIEHRKVLKIMAELKTREAAVGEKLPALLELLGSSKVDTTGLVRVSGVQVREVNLVGVRVPELDKVDFTLSDYSMLAKPFWVDFLLEAIRDVTELRIRRQVEQRRAEILQDALRKVTQRVNLFEKVLIPQARDNIRKINIFLADGQRVAVVRSKIAKAKNVAKREGQAPVALNDETLEVIDPTE